MTAASGSTPEPAVVVPDAEAWGMWGVDLQRLGFAPAASPAAASALVLPSMVPAELTEAVAEAWSRMPPPRRVVELEAPGLNGPSVAEVLAETSNGRHGGAVAGEGGDPGAEEEGHHDDEAHGGHDHEDMMAITGEPSLDGLVMEPIEAEIGPLAPGLPGGLVASVELDGDVVAACGVRASLRTAGPGGGPRARAVPDPLARATCEVAIAEAQERRAGAVPEPRIRLRRIAAVETERALSHLLWLRRFGGVLGWEELSERANAGAAPLIDAMPAFTGVRPSHEPHAEERPRPPERRREDAAAAIRSALPQAGRVWGLASGSRRLLWRARGRAGVPAAALRERGIGGPNARASGLPADARAEDPLYRELGFELRTGEAGDAQARVLQRAGEALDALRLATAALERRPNDGRAGGPASTEPPRGDAVTIESPRGPVVAAAPTAPGEPPALSAPGGSALRELAGEQAVGLEWASALVVLASFDLSPWKVPE